MQNGQSEPEAVHRYSERRRMFIVKNIKNKGTQNFEFLLF